MRLQIGLGTAFVAAPLASKRRPEGAENEPRMSRSGKRREPSGTQHSEIVDILTAARTGSEKLKDNG